MTALPVAAAAEGERTLLSIRPERVHLLDDADDADTGRLDNVFEGTVRELIYFGDHRQVRLALAGCDDFIVKVPNTAPRGLLARGDRVRVGWKAEDAHALDYMDMEPGLNGTGTARSAA